MDARLLVAHASSDAKQIRLGAETLIGRSPECNLRIASGQVSRRHCLITVADALVSVRDLGSANGTRVNGQAIIAGEDVPISPGSTLVVGPLKFIVQFTPPKSDCDTELLFQSGEAEGPAAQDVQAMSAAPVVDGEETKDYPPSRTRKRGVPPPLVVSGECSETVAEATDSKADLERGGGQSAPAHSTEAEFGPISAETVYDVSLEDQAAAEQKQRSESAGAARADAGAETDFVFEEDDLRRLAEAIEHEQAAPPAADATAAGDVPAGKAGHSGWRLLNVLRRPKIPDGAQREEGSPPAPDPTSAEEAIQKFLKDQ